MTEKSPRKRRKRRRGEIININTSQLNFEEEEGSLVANIDGDFDILSLPEIEPGLIQVIDQSDNLLLNLEEVPYIDAAAIALLERLNKSDLDLTIVCSEKHLAILERFKLNCYQDREQALATLAD